MEPQSPQPSVRPTSPAKPQRHSTPPPPLPSASLARKSPFALLVLSGPDQGKTFPVILDRDVVVGASKKAEISLGDTVASRRHASLRVVGGRLQLTDLESTNGTFVNGNRVETQVLDVGDQLLVGLSVLQVVDAAPSESAVRRVPAPPQPPVKKFRLRVLSGPDKGAEHDVPTDRPITAGASKKADISISDDVMSRRHIQLKATPTGLVIEDLGSTNGTFVNAERITRPVTLLDEDRVLIGKTILQVIEL